MQFNIEVATRVVTCAYCDNIVKAGYYKLKVKISSSVINFCPICMHQLFNAKLVKYWMKDLMTARHSTKH